MRKLLAIGAAALLSLPGAALAQGALGANYNEHFEDVDYRDLQKSDTQWVRIFLPMFQLDRGPAADHGAVKTILDVASHGYKTVLTLKFPYNRVAFPKADSETFRKDLARLEAVLPLVMGKVDILVIGNEPFIESRQQDWNPNFNAYYEALAKAAIQYRAEHCGGSACKTHLYMGALNQTQNPVWRNKTTDRWLAFIQQTPELEGLDIHPHITTIEESKAFLDYILPRMRSDQKFLVLEFSLVWWWKQHLKDPVPAAFAAKYGAPANAQTWQVIKAALETPFSKPQWDEFLSQSPWFESRKHYLRNQMKLFRDTGRLAVATYGFKQGSSMVNNFGPDSTPWLLNSVFAGRTVKPNADGSSAFNYAWIDDYKALQKK
ncbi:hypothetical protein HNP52_002694 [Sphingomonas kyeonggiensis]|uniref:Cellulase (Glycosyl hydrolase family 5) n=1 Tax=Sphingomonas kyeonggiensis TaxID=1268553 RepID=A0A7W7K3C3_9SPHN|nr:hypothetical protein [Sphingomonas kyeonggiensis]MBB4839625.1 hypothetical protein [Sphingomonas kyeonggiensis]